ncbi:MAG: RHS repeat-associated core domain-containing protein [Pyrinomonadaceae bacterium]
MQAWYDPFGNATGTLATRYGFTGRERDDATGLMYYRARFYDPKLGRFISEDPIGFGGGDINLYGYVWNNPVSFTDPMGLDGWGNDFADWADDNIEYARRFYQPDPDSVDWNTAANFTAYTASSVSNLFRVGNGLGYAIYADDENAYGRAAFVAMDVARASGLFTLFAAPIARPAAYGTEYCIPRTNIRFAPFGNRTNPPHPYGQFPHYHRQGLTYTKGNKKGQALPGQGGGRHRPFEPSRFDRRFRDRF